MPTSTMSVDRVVNFGIGKDLLDQFMQFDIRAIKKDGHDFYTYAIKKPRINKEGWEKLHDYQKYLYTDTNYTPGEFLATWSLQHSLCTRLQSSDSWQLGLCRAVVR